MGSLGLPELLFIFVLALLVFGPKRLPELGRTLGRGMSEFRRASNELKRTINTEMALDDEETKPPVSYRPQRVAEEPAPQIRTPETSIPMSQASEAEPVETAAPRPVEPH